MTQLLLSDVFAGESATTHDDIVNVASVPQRSPFRYPGGKTWLVPRIRQWLAQRPAKPYKLVEPFAGGAIVGLTAAFENLTERVTLVELDEQVAAVWQTILGGGAQWLARRIFDFDLTTESAREELAKPATGSSQLAFQTLLRNRINHGGILAPGSGILKTGENGKGIHSRWYPATLSKRILNIASIRHKITFIHGDGLEVMQNNAACPDTVFFIDPPYTAGGKKAGSRLYTHNELDHAALFDLAAKLRGDFLMTYDNDGGVRSLAQEHGFATREIAMKNTHHAQMTELLVGRDLSWGR